VHETAFRLPHKSSLRIEDQRLTKPVIQAESLRVPTLFSRPNVYRERVLLIGGLSNLDFLAIQMFRRGVFISYAHNDRRWVDRLVLVLQPLIDYEHIEIWDDHRIEPGASWHDAILNQLAAARVAVLLVSPDFLASTYIRNFELPAFLEASKSSELVILWVLIAPGRWDLTPLKDIQAAYPPSKPLQNLKPSERDKALVTISRRIEDAINANAIGNMLGVADRFGAQLDAALHNKPEPQQVPSYGLTARQIDEEVHVFRNQAKVDSITAADFEKLDSNTLQLIRAMERQMQDLYDRWTELAPKRTAADENVRKRARKESEDVRRDLCCVLHQLFAFFDSLGKALSDHYNHLRFICRNQTLI
jgi:hypothetical protein